MELLLCPLTKPKIRYIINADRFLEMEVKMMKVYLLNLDYFFENIEQNEYHTEVYSSLEKASLDFITTCSPKLPSIIAFSS